MGPSQTLTSLIFEPNEPTHIYLSSMIVIPPDRVSIRLPNLVARRAHPGVQISPEGSDCSTNPGGHKFRSDIYIPRALKTKIVHKALSSTFEHLFYPNIFQKNTNVHQETAMSTEAQAANQQQVPKVKEYIKWH